MSKVYINGRSVVHKGDGQVNTCAVPDVCKTPSPGGPVPIPYVNVARNGDLAKGSKSVSIASNPVALKDSNLSTSSGDEPGTAGGGLISSKTKGKMTWASTSIDVKFEGKGVVRFMDVTQHNGNTFNSSFIEQGGTGFAYGDDPTDGDKCPLPSCQLPKPSHALLEKPNSRALCLALHAQLSLLLQARKSPEGILKKDFRTGSYKGYMIGVLVCKKGCHIYATMSGKSLLPGFMDAVTALHDRDPRWKKCGEGAVDFTKAHNGKGPIPDGKNFFDTLPIPIIKNSKGQVVRPNPPGECAAPKLIQAANAEGHLPEEMTEVWFSPGISRTVTVIYMKNGVNTEESFSNGQTVPSCLRCQIHCTPMLCRDKDAPCR